MYLEQSILPEGDPISCTILRLKNNQLQF